MSGLLTLLPEMVITMDVPEDASRESYAHVYVLTCEIACSERLACISELSGSGITGMSHQHNQKSS